MVLSSSSFELSPRTLLHLAGSTGQKINLLILCHGAEPAELVEHLLTWCCQPLRQCVLPGPLKLPDDGSGTLLLQPVEALTRTQQIALYDWMNGAGTRPHIVSVATRPLQPLVMDGEFLEALFHRLNEFPLDARAGEPTKTWRRRLMSRMNAEDRLHP